MEEVWITPPTDFLASIKADDKDALLSLGAKRTLPKDQLIFHAGSPGEYVYILLRGRAKIYQLSSVGKEVILWFCFPGEIFGLAEAMHGHPRQVFARSCCQTQILAIQQKEFKDFLVRHPETALCVIDLLAGRLRGLGDVLLNLAADDVTSRVIKLITRLGAQYGKRINSDIYLDIPLTHQEIADMVSSSRQTVSAVLGVLKRQGVLRVENHTIYIQSPEWFENIAYQSPFSRRLMMPVSKQ